MNPAPSSKIHVPADWLGAGRYGELDARIRAALRPTLTESEFNELALEIHEFQREWNAPYARWCATTASSPWSRRTPSSKAWITGASHAGVHVVFGCGGARDRGKRPLMGEIAARMADRAIVTSDNPRSEDPASIRSAILAACPDALEIGDRAKAIEAALNALKPRDVLVVAGKGHEQGQTIGTTVHPFDDVSVIRAMVHSGPRTESGIGGTGA